MKIKDNIEKMQSNLNKIKKEPDYKKIREEQIKKSQLQNKIIK